MNMERQIKEPKISVIIPVFKVEEYLIQCVESVLNQTYTNLEVILIDDGSPDMCPALCDKYCEIDSRVIVIHKENGGISSARNAGLDIATGDVISFIDSDDWIDLEMFERMINLKLQTGADIVSCDWIHTDGLNTYNRSSLKRQYGDTVSGEVLSKEILLAKMESYVWNSLYDREYWKEIRFPIGRVFEDLPVTYLIFEKAEKVAFIDESFYKYRVNYNGITRTPNARKYYHCFLGYKEHYEHALEFYPEIVKECCSLAVSHAITVYMHACCDGRDELKQFTTELRDFMDMHEQEIDYKSIPKGKRFAIRVYYLSDALFRFLCHIFYKSGLQKAIHYDLK